MMWHRLASSGGSVLALLASLVASAQACCAPNDQACASRDPCWVQASSDSATGHLNVCTAFLAISVVPCHTVTSTGSGTTTVYDEVSVTTRTLTYVVSTTAVTTTTGTSTEIISPTIYKTGRGHQARELAAAAAAASTAACTPTTLQNRNPFVPQCSQPAAATSACNCFGVTASTTTLAPPTTYVDGHTKTKTTTGTSFTLITSTDTLISTSLDALATVTTTAPVTTVTCPDRADLKCSTLSLQPGVTSGYVTHSYNLTYATMGNYEDPNNPGNTAYIDGDDPQAYSLSANLSPCQAATRCGLKSGPYVGGSFDLNFNCTGNYWNCILYGAPNTNTSYYDIRDGNVTLGMLWNQA